MTLTPLLGAALVIGVAACGVEVPEGAGRPEPTSTTTTTEVPTTETPRGRDDVEQFLIDNGFSLAEARCGASSLRDELTHSQVEALLEAGNLAEIDDRVADAYAAALQRCLDQG
jgi:hypothetical protein